MPWPMLPVYDNLLWVSAVSAANTAVTLTLPAAGVGLFHYITHIDITRATSFAVVGSATLTDTTTNLPGNPQWLLGNALAVGSQAPDVRIDLSFPMRSSVANTATTIAAPAGGLGVITEINVAYFVW